MDDAVELGVDMFLLDDGWFANKYPRRDVYKRQGIERASTFIANVDNCLEIPETERVNMRGQERALRAYYYLSYHNANVDKIHLH